MFNIYDILRTDKDETTGTITAQLGDAISGERIIDEAEVWGPTGLAARPPNVQENATDAPQAISYSRTDGDIIFATRDVQTQSIYGNLTPGDTCLYAAGENNEGQPRILLKGTDNSINLYTAPEPGGTGMGMFINAADNAIRIINQDGFGIIIDEDGIKIMAGESSLSLGSDGKIKLIGTGSCQIDGTNIVLGTTIPQGGTAVPAGPGPNSALIGVFGMQGKPSQKVLIE